MTHEPGSSPSSCLFTICYRRPTGKSVADPEDLVQRLDGVIQSGPQDVSMPPNLLVVHDARICMLSMILRLLILHLVHRFAFLSCSSLASLSIRHRVRWTRDQNVPKP